MTADDLIRLIEMRTSLKLRSLQKRIESGTATLRDSFEYSAAVAGITGLVLSENIIGITPEERELICTALLRQNHREVNDIFAQVQENIDRRNGLTLRPRQGEFPAERVQQFAHSLVDPTVEESVIRRRARSGTENITLSFHDDSVRENAKFRNDAGLKCYIERIGSSCCDWCTEVAGKYLFGTQPKDIFRRHDNCDCVIIYDNKVLRGKLNEKGESTKTWEEVPDTERADYTPERLSRQQAEKLQNQKLSQIRGIRVDNSGRSGIISSRGSGKNPQQSEHIVERIGELDFNDKRAIAKSLQEFEYKYKDSRIEHCIVFCTNGEVYEVHGDLDTVDTELLGEKMKGSTNEHNHVTGESQYSFSWEDLSSSAKDGSHIVMAYDEKYRYSMIFPEYKLNLDEVEQAYIDADNEVGTINSISYTLRQQKEISDEDYQHEVIKRACERLGVKYERKRKA